MTIGKKEISWENQRLFTDVGDYELVVEKQKRNWECEQQADVWKWAVVYHGTIVVSGTTGDEDLAKSTAIDNVPAVASSV